MYQPEQRVIRLRATGPNHQWAMEMMTEGQIHHRDGRKWAVIQEKLNQHGLHVTIQEITFTKLQEKTEAKTMTTEIEKTKRALYGCLDRIRRAGKHRRLTAEFEERLEEHLEALRQEAGREYQLRRSAMQRIEEHVDKFSKLLEERDQIQQRLHAIDHAYCEQSNLVSRQAAELDRVKLAAQTAGDCIRDTQTVNRSYQIEIKSLNQQLQARDETIGRLRAEGRQHLDDCRSAEKLSDILDEKLRDARAVIGQQEQLIVGQRLAIADLYLVGRRVNSAVATLQRLGYTDCGGQLWKPPIGKKPEFSEDYCETCEGLGYVHCNGGRPTAPCPEGCQ